MAKLVNLIEKYILYWGLARLEKLLLFPLTIICDTVKNCVSGKRFPYIVLGQGPERFWYIPFSSRRRWFHIPYVCTYLVVLMISPNVFSVPTIWLTWTYFRLLVASVRLPHWILTICMVSPFNKAKNVSFAPTSVKMCRRWRKTPFFVDGREYQSVLNIVNLLASRLENNRCYDRVYPRR